MYTYRLIGIPTFRNPFSAFGYAFLTILCSRARLRLRIRRKPTDKSVRFHVARFRAELRQYDMNDFVLYEGGGRASSSRQLFGDRIILVPSLCRCGSSSSVRWSGFSGRIGAGRRYGDREWLGVGQQAQRGRSSGPPDPRRERPAPRTAVA